MELNVENRPLPGFGKTEPEIMGDSGTWVNTAGGGGVRA